jgi:FkbM family methyltransferase
MTRINTLYGDISVPEKDDLIKNYLIRYGEWSWNEVNFCSQFINTESVVYDIGSYIGTFTLGILNKNPSNIYSIEANPEIYVLLANNIRRLGESNCIAINQFIGDGSCVYAEEFVDQNLGGHSYHPADNLDTKTFSPISLEQLRTQNKNYTFLKIDAEGMELDIIASDFEWISENRPIVWCECNETYKSIDLFYALKYANFDIFYYAYPAFRPNNFKHNSSNIYPCAHEAGLLALPKNVNPPQKNSSSPEDFILKKVITDSALLDLLWETPRWGLNHWDSLNKVQILGILSKLYLNRSKEKFLTSDN